jgi:3-isopropylmalate/(R)-2-methylmalate dehydratase small subunit
LLPVQLSASECASIREAGEAQVDLAAQEVRWPGGTARFEIDPNIKHRLLNGLDDIALTLAQEASIGAFERDRERPGAVGSGWAGPNTTAL